MSFDDSRGVLLRSLDAHAADLEAARRREPDTPDLAAMVLLGDALALAVRAWSDILARVETPRDGSFTPARTGALIIECVFDEILPPPACAVLTAAFALALDAR